MAADCACQRVPEIKGTPGRTVTLVHGTYGQHADWMQDGHPLADSLGGLAGVVVYRFCWRGRNRHGDRLAAAKDLKQHLTALVRKYPNAEHHIVAHSHGGNVALYALRDEDGRLDETLSQVRVTTLATPFISLRKRMLPGSLIFFLGIDTLLLWIFAVLSPLALAGALHQRDWWGAALWLIVFSVCGPLSVAIPASIMTYRRGTQATLGNWDLFLGKGAAQAVIECNPPSLKPRQLLVVQGVGDEAAGLLGGAQLASWLSSRILAFTTYENAQIVWGVYFVGALLLSGAASLLSRLPAIRDDLPDVVMSLPALVLALTLGLGFAAGLVVGLFLTIANMPFGLDTLFLNLHTQLTAETSPVGTYSVQRISNPAGGDLAHGVYNRPLAIQAVANRVVGHHADIRLVLSKSDKTAKTLAGSETTAPSPNDWAELFSLRNLTELLFVGSAVSLVLSLVPVIPWLILLFLLVAFKVVETNDRLMFVMMAAYFASTLWWLQFVRNRSGVTLAISFIRLSWVAWAGLVLFAILSAFPPSPTPLP